MCGLQRRVKKLITNGPAVLNRGYVYPLFCNLTTCSRFSPDLEHEKSLNVSYFRGNWLSQILFLRKTIFTYAKMNENGLKFDSSSMTITLRFNSLSFSFSISFALLLLSLSVCPSGISHDASRGLFAKWHRRNKVSDRSRRFIDSNGCWVMLNHKILNVERFVWSMDHTSFYHWQLLLSSIDESPE